VIDFERQSMERLLEEGKQKSHLVHTVPSQEEVMAAYHDIIDRYGTIQGYFLWMNHGWHFCIVYSQGYWYGKLKQAEASYYMLDVMRRVGFNV